MSSCELRICPSSPLSSPFVMMANPVSKEGREGCRITNLNKSFNDLIFNIQNDIPDNSFSESDLVSKIISKSMSIKNGKALQTKEQQYIINSLFACKETMICPFNKKTFVKIDFSEIENMFN